MDKNAIVAKMMDNPWTWAGQDPNAVVELENRIAERGRTEKTMTYSELAKDIEFKIATVNGGMPYKIDIHNWTGLDREIIGDFLGYISAKSYRDHGFLASVIVVNMTENMPSEMFFKWMQYVGLLADGKASSKLDFWIVELKKAYRWYTKGSI